MPNGFEGRKRKKKEHTRRKGTEGEGRMRKKKEEGRRKKEDGRRKKECEIRGRKFRRQWPSVVEKGDEKVYKGGEKVAPGKRKKEDKWPRFKNRRPKEDQAKVFSSSVILDIEWWNRSGHSGLFYVKTRRIVNKMVRDIGVFRSRSRRWPAAGREEKRKNTA